MVKKAIVILAEGFEEIEASTAIDILRRAGLDVVIAGLKDIKVKGSRGMNILADKKFDEAGSDFDACVLPGGMLGAINLASSQKVRSLIKDMNKSGKIIAAICASPAIVLARLGILKGRSVTCYPGLEEKFDKDTTCKEDNVAIDGNIITSRGPATAMEFALEIVEKMCGKEMKDKLNKATLRNPA